MLLDNKHSAGPERSRLLPGNYVCFSVAETDRKRVIVCMFAECMIESALQHLVWPVRSVAELQLMNSMFVSVHAVFFRAHCSTQEVTISVISGSSLSLLGVRVRVSQQPDAVSTEADLCRGHF